MCMFHFKLYVLDVLFLSSICFRNKYEVDSGTNSERKKKQMERSDYNQERNHQLFLIIISFIHRNNNNYM